MNFQKKIQKSYQRQSRKSYQTSYQCNPEKEELEKWLKMLNADRYKQTKQSILGTEGIEKVNSQENLKKKIFKTQKKLQQRGRRSLRKMAKEQKTTMHRHAKKIQQETQKEKSQNRSVVEPEKRGDDPWADNWSLRA